ncbi:MAG: DNA alkylation repair protein [Bacteroidetes bacterium]|nr:DNA alkylation repair protein [Bacteroidota bacterium]
MAATTTTLPTSGEILKQLKALGSPSTKKVLTAHGAPEPFYGVKVGDMKPIQKKIKKDYKLSLELFDSGISDAMYLAGLIADEDKMTKKDLRHWAEKATWSMITEYAVSWVAAESRYGMELALEWIESPKENIACAGWCTLGHIAALKVDKDLDLQLYKGLIERVGKTIHAAPNRVRYCMNGFVLQAGAYITSLTDLAVKTGKAMGKIHVDQGGTACQVPSIPEYIKKMEARGPLGKKKKTVRC